ncbi:MAG TPA: glycosyltransferase family 39 protein [Gaiellaceae bacterium]|nr:glycosyltransferase family 39 protein [Gaiellaceae bacterium]
MSAGLSHISPRLQTALVALAAAALSAALNVPRAIETSFWQDEVGSARVITISSPFSMLRALVGTENHPPAFYSLGWILDRLGVPVVWDRAISVLAATAVSGLVVLYARRMMPLWGAALAGLVTALGWQFWRHGWELRPYSLFALACLLFVLALERAAEQPIRGRLALLAAAVAVGVMTHYFFVLSLCGGVVWVYLGRARLDLRRMLLAIGVGLVPLVAWAPAFYKQFEGGAFQTNPDFSLRSALETYGALLVRGHVNLLLALLVLALVLIGALRLWHLSESGRLCALCAVVPVALASLVWLAGPDIYTVKNLLGAAPFAAVAIAAALAALPRPLAIAATALAAMLLVVGYVDRRGQIIPDYDRVAALLVQEGWNEHDPILVFGPPYQLAHPLDWYLPGSRLEVAAGWREGRACDRVFVISVGGHGRGLIAGVPTRNVRRIAIARIPYRPDLAAEAGLRGGRLLATRAVRCARIA